MEQLLKLPQIRISLLEKVISQNKNKHSDKQTHTKLQHSKRLSPPQALVKGSSPYYISSKQKHHNFCAHLKCNCKNQAQHKKYHGHRYKYITKKQKGLQFLGYDKMKTQGYQYSQNDKTNNYLQLIKPIKANKILNKKYSSSDKELKQKFRNIYDKIQSKLTGLIYRKYGACRDIKNMRQQIIQHLFQVYKNKYTINNKIFSKQLSIKQTNQLLKQVMDYLQSKNLSKDLQIQQQKKNKYNSNLLRVQNSRSKSKSKSRNKSKSKSKSKQKSKKNIKQHTNKQPKSFNDKQQINSLLQIFINPTNGTLCQELVHQLMDANIQNFHQKMCKIQQILKQYRNQSNVIENICNVLEYIADKFQQLNDTNTNQNKKELFKNKVAQIRKILRFKLDNEQFRSSIEQSLFVSRKGIKSFKSMKSIKSIKSIKLLKRSQKIIRSFRQQSQQNIKVPTPERSSSNQNQNQSMLQISLVEIMEQNSNNEGQSQKKLKNMGDIVSSSGILMTSAANLLTIQGNNNQQLNIARGMDLKFTKTQKNCFFVQQPLQEIIKCRFQLPKVFKRSRNQKKTTIEPLQQQQPNFPQNVVRQSHKKKVRKSSIFKKQQQKVMKQYKKRQFEQLQKVKQFMNEQKTKQAINRGKKTLRAHKLQRLIIQQSDSLLTKKKKLRNLKQILHQLQDRHQKQLVSDSMNIANRQKMLQQLLNYIEVYEKQCNLILRLKHTQNNKGNRQDNTTTQKDGNFRNLLINRHQVYEQLKFIQLSQDYYYGEPTDIQFHKHLKQGFDIDQIVSYRNAFGQLSKKTSGDNQEGEVDNQKSEEMICSNGGDLIQTQLNCKGYFEQLNANIKKQIRNKKSLKTIIKNRNLHRKQSHLKQNLVSNYTNCNESCNGSSQTIYQKITNLIKQTKLTKNKKIMNKLYTEPSKQQKNISYLYVHEKQNSKILQNSTLINKNMKNKININIDANLGKKSRYNRFLLTQNTTYQSQSSQLNINNKSYLNIYSRFSQDQPNTIFELNNKKKIRINHNSIVQNQDSRELVKIRQTFN